MSTALDVVTIGRSSVDLYGQQIGGRLEDMASFAKSVGGSPTNTAIGASRLGLKAGLVTRVGDEHFGRFIREQLMREGVDTRGVKTDPKRLTALAILGVQDDKRFPLIFYRHDCADMGLVEDDIDEGYIASAKAVCLSGTHFSTATTDAMNRKAIRAAKAAGRLVAFDVDYRPSLWGLAGLGAGEERYIRSDTVTAHLQTIAPDCDLIVGTEEELHILGGSQDTLEALRRIRALTRATLVCKRGPMGCVVFPERDPGAPSRTASRARAFRSRSTTCSAPATPSWAASCAAGFAMSRWSRPAPTPTPAAPSRCRASCARPSIRPGRSCSISSGTAPRRRACGSIRRSATSIGRRRAGRRPRPSRRLPSTTAGSSRRWRTGSARRGRGFRGSSGLPCGRWRKSPRRPPVRASRLGLPASHLSMRGVVRAPQLSSPHAEVRPRTSARGSLEARTGGSAFSSTAPMAARRCSRRPSTGSGSGGRSRNRARARSPSRRRTSARISPNGRSRTP